MDEVVKRNLEQKGFNLGRRLGYGGFAEVWEAVSPTGVPCAIKVSLRPLEENADILRKELNFLENYKHLSGHPHLVAIIDVEIVGESLVSRWELADGGTLADLLRRCQEEGRSGVPMESLLSHIQDAAEGIDFLNNRGIYHRDIKPSNLLLFHGRVKVGDVGLAKLVEASIGSHTMLGT